MTGRDTDSARDLGSLVVPAAGGLVETGDLWEPYYLSDPAGGAVGPVSEFLRDLQAAGRPATTQRSYSLALLRWFRFTWAVGVPWDQATRAEARDFCRWLQLADKPGRLPAARGTVPGKRPASARYAPSTVAHCETVCRSFYAYHLEAGTGPIVNPFPLARPGRAHAHHNPMDPFPRQKAGLFRPRVPRRVPRQIPDSVFNELFARLRLEPGPGAGRVLGLHRRTGLGAPRRPLLGRRPGPAADHRDPQGIAGDAAAPGVAGRVRVAAALPAGGARAWCPPGRTTRCGGRCGGRSGRWPITRPGRCSTGRTPRSAPGGRCTPCGTRRPTGSPVTRHADHRRAMGTGPRRR